METKKQPLNINWVAVFLYLTFTLQEAFAPDFIVTVIVAFSFFFE